jgi:hypothetical protein
VIPVVFQTAVGSNVKARVYLAISAPFLPVDFGFAAQVAIF